MDRTTRTEPLDLPQRGRRRFLKQMATTGVMAATGAVAGTLALPACAQDKAASPAMPGAPAAAADRRDARPLRRQPQIRGPAGGGGARGQTLP